MRLIVDKQLAQIMKDVDKDLSGIMPQIAERMKKRIYLAYLYGTQDTDNETSKRLPEQLTLSLTSDQ